MTTKVTKVTELHDRLVVETECGHIHARPLNWKIKKGDEWDCILCDDEKKK